MELIPNFPISNRGRFSFELINKGVRDFHAAIEYIKNLPYGRISLKDKLELVVIEGRGTCSTKHSILIAVAEENGFKDLKLKLGIYKMDNTNTPGVAPVLEKFGLNYLPEAHNYIEYKNKRYDFTFIEGPASSPFDSLMEEVDIQLNQIQDYKVDYHRAFLGDWLKKTKLQGRWNLDKLWKVREDCIKELSGIKDHVVVS